MHLLIDADTLLYQSLLSAQVEKVVDDEVSLTLDLTEARMRFTEVLSNLLRKKMFTDFTLCLSDDENFRKDIDPTYKEFRKATRKPLGFKLFKQTIKDAYPCVQKPKLEADDVVGILATKPGNDYVIYSPDKDLLQIPGKHYINKKIVNVTHIDGHRFHMFQTLIGDTTDGYKGCPGVGPVKAHHLLDKAVDEDYWPIVVKAFGDEEKALVQARLAKILQWENWDTDKQEPILWTPK